MKEIEIVAIPALQPNERTFVDMHTLLNMFNVLRGELALIGITLADEPDFLKPALATCDRLVAALRERSTAIAAAADVNTHIATIRTAIADALVERERRVDDPELLESLANLDSVFALLTVRAKEILARTKAPDAWLELPVQAIRDEFMAVFKAIEKNSHGRYRLLFNPALQEPPDYYIDFKMDSIDEPNVCMPIVFKDVMRDLIANARKYTAPGGRITAALHAGRDALKFFVEDTGRGIPEGELETVVEYGKRASNVADVRTMGGGFGLTKAFLVTKQFGGRFYIASALGVGTRVRITIPRANVRVGAAAPRELCHAV